MPVAKNSFRPMFHFHMKFVTCDARSHGLETRIGSPWQSRVHAEGCMPCARHRPHLAGLQVMRSVLIVLRNGEGNIWSIVVSARLLALLRNADGESTDLSPPEFSRSGIQGGGRGDHHLRARAEGRESS
jgi:hypothetical protein